jgi:dihydroorotate dehydrogenase electron transfer subunit
MPMLIALAKILQKDKTGSGELSLDHLMCCGVGACFACVVKVKADNEEGWRYARTCKEGPVFNAQDIYTGE